MTLGAMTAVAFFLVVIVGRYLNQARRGEWSLRQEFPLLATAAITVTTVLLVERLPHETRGLFYGAALALGGGAIALFGMQAGNSPVLLRIGFLCLTGGGMLVLGTILRLAIT